jgi:hypothetical protein
VGECAAGGLFLVSSQKLKRDQISFLKQKLHLQQGFSMALPPDLIQEFSSSALNSYRE